MHDRPADGRRGRIGRHRRIGRRGRHERNGRHGQGAHRAGTGRPSGRHAGHRADIDQRGGRREPICPLGRAGRRWPGARSCPVARSWPGALRGCGGRRERAARRGTSPCRAPAARRETGGNRGTDDHPCPGGRCERGRPARHVPTAERSDPVPHHASDWCEDRGTSPAGGPDRRDDRSRPRRAPARRVAARRSGRRVARRARAQRPDRVGPGPLGRRVPLQSSGAWRRCWSCCSGRAGAWRCRSFVAHAHEERPKMRSLQRGLDDRRPSDARSLPARRTPRSGPEPTLDDSRRHREGGGTEPVVRVRPSRSRWSAWPADDRPVGRAAPSPFRAAQPTTPADPRRGSRGSAARSG